MWHIVNIECENFISFKNLCLNVPQDKCSLIYGINKDNTKQPNNGTGKSTIIEAISFALTGESLRGVKDAELINDNADTAKVILTVENDYDDNLLIITRILDRNNPQRITCEKFDANDNRIDMDKTVQPSVLEYNRYILDEIGISKGDLYNNFILCHRRYESFFDASDKSKKAMINHFSGADAVDQSIEALKVDMVPIQEKLNAAHDNKVAMQAKVDVIESQIKDAESQKEQYFAERESKIQTLEEQIAQKRQSVREYLAQKSDVESRIDVLKHGKERLGSIEASKDTSSLTEDYNQISVLFQDLGIALDKDYVAESQGVQKCIDAYQIRQKEVEKALVSAKSVLDELKSACEAVKREKEALEANNAEEDKLDMEDLSDIKDELNECLNKINDYNVKIAQSEHKSDALHRDIRNLENILHGAITCPKCKYQFLLSGEDVGDIESEIKIKTDEKESINGDIELYKAEIDKLHTTQVQLNTETDAIRKDMQKRKDGLYAAENRLITAMRNMHNAEADIDNAQANVDTIVRRVASESSKLSHLHSVMYDSAYSILDIAISKCLSDVTAMDSKIVAAQSSMEVYQNSIKEIENGSVDDLTRSLQENKAQYQEMLKKAIADYDEIQVEYNKYEIQENNFTQFKSHLANKKIDAIAAVTNSFLDKIGSDLRVELLGYKVLKTGKLRDKITVNLLRNGILCGSYAKFSGGEKARVNLASILALNKLTNNACADGKGLDMVILDEILEASDSVGIESCCQALNVLKATSLLVTQNPVVDHDGLTITVVKENGYSYIEG